MAQKRKLSKNKVTGLILMCVSILLVGTMVSRCISIYKQRETLANVKKQEEKLKKEADNLQEELNLLDDEDYITHYARENWVFTKDGETMIPLPDDAKGE